MTKTAKRCFYIHNDGRSAFYKTHHIHTMNYVFYCKECGDTLLEQQRIAGVLEGTSIEPINPKLQSFL